MRTRTILILLKILNLGGREMLDGLLIGIFGKRIFAVIQGMVTALLGEKDDDLNNRIYGSLELATKDFFKQYGQIYQPYSSFLARESNIRFS